MYNKLFIIVVILIKAIGGTTACNGFLSLIFPLS